MTHFLTPEAPAVPCKCGQKFTALHGKSDYLDYFIMKCSKCGKCWLMKTKKDPTPQPAPSAEIDEVDETDEGAGESGNDGDGLAEPVSAKKGKHLMVNLTGLHARFKDVATRRGLTMAEITRRLIFEEIERDEDRMLDRNYKLHSIRKGE